MVILLVIFVTNLIVTSVIKTHASHVMEVSTWLVISAKNVFLTVKNAHNHRITVFNAKKDTFMTLIYKFV